MEIGEHLNQVGWRQGRFVRESDHARLLDFQVQEGCRLVVISQSCDVLRSVDKEPTIEVIIAESLLKIDPQLTSTRSSRELHLTIQSVNGDNPYSLSQHDKLIIDKTLFEGLIPDDDITLGIQQVEEIAEWLAARYQRPAFPNKFEKLYKDATKKADNKIRKNAKKISSKVASIYLKIHPFAELEDGEYYDVSLLALIPPGVEADPASPDIVDPINAIVAILEAAGMEVAATINFENAVPYGLVRRNYKIWNFTDISFANDPVDPIP